MDIHTPNEPSKPENGNKAQLQAVGIVLGSVLITALIRFALEPWLHGRMAFVLFYPAILFSTWACGVSAGITASILGGLAGIFLFSNDFPWSSHGSENIIGIIVYMASAAAIVIMTALMRRAMRWIDR